MVADDHSIYGKAPGLAPVGEHEVIITLVERTAPPKFFRSADLPIHDLPWDDRIALRREDIYGDDGR